MKKIIQQGRFFENLLLSFFTGLILSYLLTGSFVYSYTLENSQTQSVVIRLLLILMIGIIFFAYSYKQYSRSRLLFVVLLIGFVSITLLRDTNLWTQIGFCVFTLIIIWMLRQPLLELFRDFHLNNPKLFFTILILISVLLFGMIALVGLLRVETFRSADFDLGLFSQMFEQMRISGKQYTTIERDRFMSHFGVHISPIFYLMLPFYMLFPFPHTLQILQALLVALSIWPLYLLCRQYKLSNKLTVFVISLYALYPALSGSCFNDFHENSILPLFLLFLIWAYEKDKTIFIVLFSILTFSVKEDAAILVGCLGLYYFLAGKRKKKAIILFISSILYFFLAVAVLNTIGDGMLGYMTNFVMNGKNGLPEILSALVLNPGYALLQCFNLPEKLYYLCFLILPLGAGLITRHYHRYLLLLPFILMNLMPDYNAVYTLEFQYHFGVTVFLFYILIQNLSETSTEKIKVWALLSISAAIILFVPTSLKTSLKAVISYVSEQETNSQIEEALSMIPEDVSVNASPKLVPYFYRYQEIYPITSLLPTDYVILDRRPDMMMYEDEILDKYYRDGYEQIYYLENIIEIYKIK